MARKRPATAMYFTTLVVTADDFAILGGHLYSQEQEPTVTRIVLLNRGKGFFLYDLDGLVYAMARKPKPAGGSRDTLCLMGRTGRYREHPAGGKAVDARIDLKARGFFLDLRTIGDRLYACGLQNIVYRQDGRRWTRIDQGAFVPARKESVSFEAIDGFTERDIFAVGAGGAVWNWNGSAWKRLPSPTDLDLYAVRCASDGEIYIAGGGGRVFKGGRQGWKDLSSPRITNATIWDMVEFQDRVYLAAHDKLLVTSGGRVREVHVPIRGAKSFMTLDATPRQLWTAGEDSILQFNGKKWIRHIWGDNI